MLNGIYVHGVHVMVSMWRCACGGVHVMVCM